MNNSPLVQPAEQYRGRRCCRPRRPMILAPNAVAVVDVPFPLLFRRSTLRVHVPMQRRWVRIHAASLYMYIKHSCCCRERADGRWSIIYCHTFARIATNEACVYNRGFLKMFVYYRRNFTSGFWWCDADSQSRNNTRFIRALARLEDGRLRRASKQRSAGSPRCGVESEREAREGEETGAEYRTREPGVDMFLRYMVQVWGLCEVWKLELGVRDGFRGLLIWMNRAIESLKTVGRVWVDIAGIGIDVGIWRVYNWICKRMFRKFVWKLKFTWD